jgi:hypothetical protein
MTFTFTFSPVGLVHIVLPSLLPARSRDVGHHRTLAGPGRRQGERRCAPLPRPARRDRELPSAADRGNHLPSHLLLSKRAEWSRVLLPDHTYKIGRSDKLLLGVKQSSVSKIHATVVVGPHSELDAVSPL